MKSSEEIEHGLFTSEGGSHWPEKKYAKVGLKGWGSAGARFRGMGMGSAGARLRGLGRSSVGAGLRGMGRGSAGVR